MSNFSTTWCQTSPWNLSWYQILRMFTKVNLYIHLLWILAMGGISYLLVAKVLNWHLDLKKLLILFLFKLILFFLVNLVFVDCCDLWWWKICYPIIPESSNQSFSKDPLNLVMTNKVRCKELEFSFCWRKVLFITLEWMDGIKV